MLNNKKILVLATTDNMIWQFLIPHIKHLEERGNKVECACAKTGFWFDELESVYGIKLHQIDFTRSPLTKKNLKAYKALKNLQKQNNYELIYCQQPVGGLMGRLLGKKFKIPVIYTAHGFHFFKDCSFKRKLVYKTAEKWLSKYTDVLITINEEDFEVAKTFKAKSVYKINGIGVDTNKYKVEEFDHRAFKKELGVSLDDKIVLAVSEINKNKNYETMLKTMQLLIKEDSKINLLACGTGELEEDIKTMSKEMGLENNVIFLGFRKDIPKIMQITDVFFHTSFREGLNLSIMEAMFYGTPCVVSNVRGNRDLIENGKGGFVEEPTNFQAFAKHIKTLLDDKSLYNTMSKYNKEQSKQYTVEFVKEQLDKIYDEIDF